MRINLGRMASVKWREKNILFLLERDSLRKRQMVPPPFLLSTREGAVFE